MSAMAEDAFILQLEVFKAFKVAGADLLLQKINVFELLHVLCFCYFIIKSD